MSQENHIKEYLTHKNAKQFAVILHDTISSYIQNKDRCTIDEWLNSYLTEHLPDKSTAEISDIADTIIRTTTLHNETIVSMRNAVESGRTVESWFQNETAFPEYSSGERARELVEIHSALTDVVNQYSELEQQQEVIDVDTVLQEEWSDDAWNKYKIKDLVSETVKQAGEAAICTTASDLYQKVTEYGFQSILTDRELISESMILGADAGLKTAVAGAMEIAESQGILPSGESDTTSRSLLASIAIENVKILGKIARGDIGLSDGLAMMQDTGIATLATIIKAKAGSIGRQIGSKIGATVGTVFGPVGTVIGNFVGGAVGRMAGTTVGSKIAETAKRIGTVAKSVVSRAVSTVRSIGNTIKSGLRSLFSW